MIEYLLVSVVVTQLLLLGKTLYDAIKRRATARQRIMQIEKIIPQIKKHPNPILADLMWRMGKNMSENDDDPSWRMLGSCLMNYHTLLIQEISKEYLYQSRFVMLAQNTMTKLKVAFEQNRKAKFAEFAFEMSRLLFDYPSVEEDLSASELLEKTLQDASRYLKDRNMTVHSLVELDKFRIWNRSKLRTTDPYLRFLYFHVIRWCSQLPFEYGIDSGMFLKKSRELSRGIEKGMRLAKKRNLLSLYLVMSMTYGSLFPKSKPTLSYEDFFPKPKSSSEVILDYGRIITENLRSKIGM
jgi:hypothetical protein